MSNLPYVASPGNIPKALDAIKRAATPPKVSQDFVKTKLSIPGSSGDQMATFLKRIGFSNSDGSPTDLYRDFRTDHGGAALAQAIRFAYAPLYELNEYMHDSSEKDLKDLIIKETGLASDARPIYLIYSSLKHLLDLADFDSKSTGRSIATPIVEHKLDQNITNLNSGQRAKESPVGLNIGYTINLNLPETTNIEVFNAIFKSLREHLLRSDDV
jgi:Family of unknown function (DUF5343)